MDNLDEDKLDDEELDEFTEIEIGIENEIIRVRIPKAICLEDAIKEYRKSRDKYYGYYSTFIDE